MAMIELHRVSKCYRIGSETVRALDDVDLRIEEGEFTAILGPSGSGKSTMMHILGFLDRPTEGRLLFDGRDVSSIGAAERARIRAAKVGFVFQAFNLLPRLTVLQNVTLPLSYQVQPPVRPDQAAHDALERVDLLDRLRHRPNQLSGGQRQRVAIARALVIRPRLILADEPTGNLDSQTARNILDLFSDLHREGATILLVTHDPNVASCATRQLHMLDGRIERDTAA